MVRSVTLLLSCVSAALCANTLLAATLPPGFSEFAITGPHVISNVTAMEFAPDGKLFVLEQGGAIEVYQGSGPTVWTQLQANFLADVSIAVDDFYERGLLGIAFDPDYANNRFVYLYYTTSTPPVHNRIVRVTANAAGDLAVAGSLTSLMELEDLNAGNHNGGAIHFGPDGKLYVAVGENANPANAQSISNRLGKILRLNPDPADPIPADNPTSIAGIAGTTTGLNRAIWAAGLRNPFTFAFKSGTSVMYINDVGADTWEEVNIGSAGANYGWSATEGPFTQAAFPNFTHPIIYYHQKDAGQSFPPLAGFTGNVIAGGAFYVPANPTFPADYVGDYFFADHGGSWIKRYDAATQTVQNFAFNAASPLDLRVGSDGALYYLARNPGRVFRVQITCTGNINGDATVDVNDLLVMIGAWASAGGPADLNADGTVDVNDLLLLIGAWGPCP